MVASCMFYGALPPGNPADENRIGNFSFTWGQVRVSYFLILSCLKIIFKIMIKVQKRFGVIRSLSSVEASMCTLYFQTSTISEIKLFTPGVESN